MHAEVMMVMCPVLHRMLKQQILPMDIIFQAGLHVSISVTSRASKLLSSK